MRRISVRRMYLVKWLGPLILFLVVAAWQTYVESRKAEPHFDSLVWAFVVVAIIMIWVFRRSCWHLADEVSDDGPQLVVRFGSKVDRVNVSDISAVKMGGYSGSTITLTLAAPCRFGTSISFLAGVSTRGKAITDLVQDLTARAKGAEVQRPFASTTSEVTARTPWPRAVSLLIAAGALAYLVLTRFVSNETVKGLLGVLFGIVCILMLRRAYKTGAADNLMGPGREFRTKPVVQDLLRSGVSIAVALMWALASGIAIRFRVLPDTALIVYPLMAAPIMLLLASFVYFLARGAYRATFGLDKRNG